MLDLPYFQYAYFIERITDPWLFVPFCISVICWTLLYGPKWLQPRPFREERERRARERRARERRNRSVRATTGPALRDPNPVLAIVAHQSDRKSVDLKIVLENKTESSFKLVAVESLRATVKNKPPVQQPQFTPKHHAPNHTLALPLGRFQAFQDLLGSGLEIAADIHLQDLSSKTILVMSLELEGKFRSAGPAGKGASGPAEIEITKQDVSFKAIKPASK